MLQDIFLTTRQCLTTVCRLWFSKNFVWCLPNALLTYLKNIAIFCHKQQNWTILFVSAFKVKTLVRKRLRLIPQKSHNNARDYIQYNKYIHSIGHWNNQSIVPINRWKSNHVRDVVLTKRCWNASKKIAILKQLQTHFETKREKGVGTPFPSHYTPEPCTLAWRRSTFYQHSQFLKRLLVQRKHERTKKRNLNINCHKSCSSDTYYIA